MKYFDITPVIERLKKEIIQKDEKLYILTDSNPNNLSYCKSIKNICNNNSYFKDTVIVNVDEIEYIPSSYYFRDGKIFVMASLLNHKYIKQINMLLSTSESYSDVKGFDSTHFLTPTPDSIIDIIKEYSGVDLEGKQVCVVNRSNLIGRPVIDKLLDLNATVCCCHSKTGDINLQDIFEDSDIIITACGKPNTFTWGIGTGLYKNKLIVDAGINVVDGKICGDWNYQDLNRLLSTDKITITPNPNGVGKVTTYELVKGICA